MKDTNPRYAFDPDMDPNANPDTYKPGDRLKASEDSQLASERAAQSLRDAEVPYVPTEPAHDVPIVPQSDPDYYAQD